MSLNSLDYLGYKATDKVTGFSGVVTSVCFDLYGCVQAIITPPAVDGKDLQTGSWFDINRLALSGERVMPVPDFGDIAPENYQKGAAHKPIP